MGNREILGLFAVFALFLNLIPAFAQTSDGEQTTLSEDLQIILLPKRFYKK